MASIRLGAPKGLVRGRVLLYLRLHSLLISLPLPMIYW
jgi:hypothetical protein